MFTFLYIYIKDREYSITLIAYGQSHIGQPVLKRYFCQICEPKREITFPPPKNILREISLHLHIYAQPPLYFVLNLSNCTSMNLIECKVIDSYSGNYFDNYQLFCF